jgi:hypothetical protein
MGGIPPAHGWDELTPLHAVQLAQRDPAGRRYSIDTSGSFELAIWNEDAEIQTPEALQLHPGSPGFVQLMFDLPPELASNESARLGFAKNQFRLIFPAEASDLPD